MTFRPLSVSEVSFHEEAGEAFLLHVKSGEYFGLNRAGVIVWSALLDGTDPEQELARWWPDVPEDELRRDARQLLQALLEAGLVVHSPSSAGEA